MKRWFDLAGLFPIDLRDFLAFLGLACLALGGGGLVSPALGFLLAGGALFYLGVFHGRGGE